jgi:ribonuclease HI
MEIDIFTDGSLIRKKGDIYCGYGIYFPNGENDNISKKFDKGLITNNRAELYAIYKSLKICKKILKEKEIKKINIYSDSEYSVKTLTIWYKNWIKNGKDYKNKDIIDKTIKLINKLNNVNFIHIKAHTGENDYYSLSNNQADELAKGGALK